MKILLKFLVLNTILIKSCVFYKTNYVFFITEAKKTCECMPSKFLNQDGSHSLQQNY